MWSLLKESVKDFLDDDCPRMAAALSYYAVFSLPPLLVLLMLVLGSLVEPGQVEGRVQSEISSVLGQEGAESFRTILRNAQPPEGAGLSWILGGIGLLFGATGAFAQLQEALNRAWDVAPRRDRSTILQFLLKRALSLGMVLTVAFLVLLSVVLSAVLSGAGEQIGGWLPTAVSGAALQAANTGLSFLLVALLFAAIFMILPDADVAWKDVAAGAVITALLFVAGKYAIGLYIGRSDPGSAYGAAGSLVAVLLWIYVSSLLLLYGAELTQVRARQKGRAISPADHAVRISDPQPGR